MGSIAICVVPLDEPHSECEVCGKKGVTQSIVVNFKGRTRYLLRICAEHQICAILPLSVLEQTKVTQ